MINFEKTLKEVSGLLSLNNYKFAVAGGIVANIYRNEIRTTLDLDFLFYTDTEIDKAAAEFLENLGLNVHFLKEHDLKRLPAMHKKRQPNFIAVGRLPDKNELGIDLLLPPFPWFSSALSRAQQHLIDYGFAKLPTVTAEDMILMKLYAGRNKDLDDLDSILKAKPKLDVSYIKNEMGRMDLKFPKEIKKIHKTIIR